MNENNKGYLRIPYPILMLLGTIFIASITWSIASATNKKQDAVEFATTKKQVEVNTGIINDEIKPDIQKLKDTKVDKADYEWVRNTLIRIEGKIDTHMNTRNSTASK